MKVHYLSKSSGPDNNWKKAVNAVVEKSRDGDWVVCEDSDVMNWVRRVVTQTWVGRKLNLHEDEALAKAGEGFTPPTP